MRASGVENASYRERLEVTKVKSRASCSLRHTSFRMLKITSIGGVNKKI